MDRSVDVALRVQQALRNAAADAYGVLLGLCLDWPGASTAINAVLLTVAIVATVATCAVTCQRARVVACDALVVLALTVASLLLMTWTLSLLAFVVGMTVRDMFLIACRAALGSDQCVFLNHTTTTTLPLHELHDDDDAASRWW